ncbi:MAG: UMP kinase [Candidatus Hadarchaeota archaeon]
MKVTICFGGSMFNPKELEVDIIEKIANKVQELEKNGYELLIVTGGGNTARTYIEAAKNFSVSKNELDKLGIEATRLNARLLSYALGKKATKTPPKNFEKAVSESLSGKVPIMGGTQPGHTTDAVAANLAGASKSDLLIYFTNVEGVYTEDPNENEDAEKISEMTTSELSRLMEKMGFEPGMTSVIDPLASEIIQQNKIKTLVLGAAELGRLKEIIEGADHSGTTIKPGSNSKGR